MNNIPIIVYSDGSSRGNPGPGGFGSIVIYPDSHGRLRIDEFGGAENPTTNNRMEIQGVIEALSSLVGYYGEKMDKKEIKVYTDSGYLVNGVTAWIAGWKRNNWITKTKEPVKNVDLWEKLDEIIVNLKKEGLTITWIQVPGHAGVPGNERCDEIATLSADLNDPHLFKGFVEEYPRKEVLKSITSSDIETLKGDKKSKGKSSSAKAYSYVSLVDGVVLTHQTWAECENRVKGKSNTRFKKSVSKEDEDKIIADFTSRK